MIAVDSSVWIDYFNGAASRETELLDRVLGVAPVVICDLILVEVLEGFRDDRDLRRECEANGGEITDYFVNKFTEIAVKAIPVINEIEG